MKNKKSLIILGVLIICFILIFVFSDKKVKKEKDKEKILNIVEKKVINKKDYGSLVNQNNKFILFSDGKTYTLFDRDLKEILKSEKEITLYEDAATNKYYYFVDDELFDEDNKSIYKGQLHLDSIDNNFLVFGNSTLHTIYDMLNKKEYKNSYIMNSEDVYIEDKHYDKINIIIQNDKVFYIYIDSGIKEYKKMDYNSDGTSITFSNADNDKLVVAFTAEPDKIKLTDDYYLSVENNCKQLKKYKDNSSVSDKCFVNFEKNNNIENFVVTESTDFFTFIILPNGEFIEKEKIATGSFSKDKYLYSDSGENDSIVKIVNSDGSIVESKCVGELTLHGENYVCRDKYDTYLLDKNFEKITDYYDNIDCIDNEYCSISKETSKGIIYKDQVIIEPKYLDIILLKDYIIAEGIFEYDLYYLGEGKQIDKSELSENKIDIDIDVDKVITDYKLDDIKEIIENNKEDFKIYAYIVLNNDKLGDYKKYVLDYFKVYVDKIEYINKDFFLMNLMNLKIGVYNKITEGAAGDYSDSIIRLLSLYKDDSSVIYHELMHFIDYEFNSNSAEIIYKYNDKIINRDEYRKLSINEKEKVNYKNYGASNNNFFTEGGAEYYSQYYFHNGITDTYEIPVKILHCLFALYGDEVDDVFFGNKSLGTLLFKDISTDEYDKFTSLANQFTHNKTSFDSKDYMNLLDMIVNIYNKHDSNWLNNNKLTYSIYSLIPLHYDDYTLKLSKNYNIYKSILNKYLNVEKNYVSETNDKKTTIAPHLVAYYKGNFYIYTGKYDKKQEIVLKYDHENNKYVKVN